MKIKIDIKNVTAIQAVLNQANGRSTAHTFTSAAEIIERAANAEQQLASLGLIKSLRAGATATASSGGSLPNAYKYQRIVGAVTLVRGSSAWFLVSATTGDSWCKKAGETRIALTSSQDAAVTEIFRSGYGKQ
ncbi:hypothetical protein [Propionivibrio sp.]|uniref:hypothetical protein n=1 Tax=Propionivibrio sp. TaxID=2212460 RepID=UPI003BF128F6